LVFCEWCFLYLSFSRAFSTFEKLADIFTFKLLGLSSDASYRSLYLSYFLILSAFVSVFEYGFFTFLSVGDGFTSVGAGGVFRYFGAKTFCCQRRCL
jgi:hypothetical protein